MRTLDDIEKELREAKNESDSLRRKLEQSINKENSLYKEMIQFRLDNGMYHPMSDLKQYAGKNVNSIQLVKKNNDGTLGTKTMYNSSIFIVNDLGHLDYLSYYSGSMHFNENEEVYEYVCFPKVEVRKYDFVGYISIDVK